MLNNSGTDRKRDLPEHIRCQEKFGSLYFRTMRKQEFGEGPQYYMLVDMKERGNTFAVCYQPSEKDRWYASYANIDAFLKHYATVLDSERKFYEILCGATHTYADLEWSDNVQCSLVPAIVVAFESLFWTCAEALLDIPFEAGKTFWSTSSQAEKGSLHFKFELEDFSWPNSDTQKNFWEKTKAYLEKHKNEPRFSALFVKDKCVIDWLVYTKNRAWRCIGSHKSESTRTLVPYGTGKESISSYFVSVEQPVDSFTIEGQQEQELMVKPQLEFHPAVGYYFDDLNESMEDILSDSELPPAMSYDGLGWSEEFIVKLVADKIPNARFSRMLDKNLARLQTVGERYCLINGELNTSDNCFVFRKGKKVFFGCKDEGCKGKKHLLHTFKAQTMYDPLNNLFRSDEGLSDMFVALERENIRVVDPKGTCYIWSDDTKLWESLHKRHIANRISTILEGVIQNAQAEHADDEAKQKELTKLMTYVLSSKGSSAILQKVLPKLEDFKFSERLNGNPDLLPLRDGQVVMLRTGATRTRTREDMFSFECPVSVCENESQLQRVDQFLLSIANGDSALKEFLRRQLGYCLTGRTSERVFFIWWGKGANGKSTLCNLMKRVLANYYVAASKDVFIKGGTGQNRGSATPHLVPLINSRMAVFAESSNEESLNAEQIKSLSGNDSISYRPLFGTQSEFIPVCKLIMQTNHKPSFDVSDTAVSDRIRFNPFLARFVPVPDARKLNERVRDCKLVQELETTLLDAFFTWVLEGAVAWYKNGLGQSPALVEEEMAAYVEELDDIGRFLAEYCVLGETFSISASAFYDEYKAWVTTSGEKVKSIKEFGLQMGTRFVKKRSNKSNMYTGVKLADEQVADEVVEEPINDFLEELPDVEVPTRYEEPDNIECDDELFES
jgi:P4 family phage/plasmid primase-like protien